MRFGVRSLSGILSTILQLACGAQSTTAAGLHSQRHVGQTHSNERHRRSEDVDPGFLPEQPLLPPAGYGNGDRGGEAYPMRARAPYNCRCRFDEVWLGRYCGDGEHWRDLCQQIDPNALLFPFRVDIDRVRASRSRCPYRLYCVHDVPVRDPHQRPMIKCVPWRWGSAARLPRLPEGDDASDDYDGEQETEVPIARRRRIDRGTYQPAAAAAQNDGEGSSSGQAGGENEAASSSQQRHHQASSSVSLSMAH